MPDGVEVVHDGSVNGLTAVNPTGERIPLYTGEYPSEILELSKYPLWMKKNYPTAVNKTCGMHVHMSFFPKHAALHYSRLMVPEYTQTIILYVAKWALEEKLDKKHPIWDRLNGKNTFCKLEFYPDEQAKSTKKVFDHAGRGNRYTVINYCHAQHSTVECRLLPMMDNADLAIRAIKRVIDVTNACLVALKGREEKIEAKLTVDQSLEGIDELQRIYI